MSHIMLKETLEFENAVYAGTGGVSKSNRAHGFVPGFLDTDTGIVYRSCDATGRPASIHRLDGLPAYLIETRTAAGKVARVKRSIMSGFLRGGEFYTRSEAAVLVNVAPVVQ
jgi:hypothetical protein